ncbi:hypothetical protein RJ640_012329 [Escallonia rubra]|uniref:Uncharacterized protein n=1 Tax=Escallonia rubra TaxID=112253 RepID=A0AA88RIL8_9ASTE|nr:hypothetical protein RJ640_012329 [Escallonia rubra]
MFKSIKPPISSTNLSTPLLSSTTTTTASDSDETPENSNRFQYVPQPLPNTPTTSYKSLAVLSVHAGTVSSLAVSGEFLLSASQGKDIIVWQQPDLHIFAKFGHGGGGAVKALVTLGNKVFTAHQDSRVRVWRISRSSENVFKLVDTLPTTKDYLGKCLLQKNYVQTRRHHKRLWIEHADSISCLAVRNGLIYSGSWDKTLKVWRIGDLKCLESIKAHDDAINGLVASKGVVFSASADGKIKVWGLANQLHSLMGILEGHRDASFNAVVVSEDGRWVYGGGSDGYLMGWKGNAGFDSWRLVCEVRGHKMAVLCMCLRGDILCSGSADKSIGVWKRELGGGVFRIGVIRGHEGPVKCLQVSPNCVGGGFMLYSGSLDKSLRVWRAFAAASQILGTIEGKNLQIPTVRFTWKECPATPSNDATISEEQLDEAELQEVQEAMEARFAANDIRMTYIKAIIGDLQRGQSALQQGFSELKFQLAECWYSAYIKSLGKVSSEKFVKDLYVRFSLTNGISVMGDFNRLVQTGSVDEYFNKFKSMRAHVVQEFD